MVVGAVALSKDDERHILFISELGYGKRSKISEFPIHNRGGKGVTCHKASDKLGQLCGIQAVSDEDDVMLITNTGMIIRTRVNEISVYSRTAAGVRVMRIGEDMKIVSFTRVDKQEEQENTEGEESVQAEGIEDAAEVENAPAPEVSETQE